MLISMTGLPNSGVLVRFTRVGPDDELLSFGEPDPLHEIHIQPEEAGAGEGIRRDIAEPAGRRVDEQRWPGRIQSQVLSGGQTGGVLVVDKLWGIVQTKPGPSISRWAS